MMQLYFWKFKVYIDGVYVLLEQEEAEVENLSGCRSIK
jgi:hypothetical protein